MKRKRGRNLQVKRGMICFFAALVLLLFIAFPGVPRAEMTVMTDDELAQVVGQGFSKFTLVDGVALAEFDIRVLTYTEIESLKLAYYNNGSGDGWDENWTNVKFGSSEADEDLLDMRGFFIRAEFENITNDATRQLKRFQMGFTDVNGTLEADFNSFSGDLTLSGSTTAHHRSFLGNREFQLTNSELSLSINIDGPNKGMYYTISNAQTTS